MTAPLYTADQVDALLCNQSRVFGYLLYSVTNRIAVEKSSMLHEIVDDLAFRVRKTNPDFELVIDHVLDGFETARYDFEADAPK